jgi:hypothetical protein
LACNEGTNSVTFSGVDASLVWGYHEAATLKDWTITADTLTAKVVSFDAFRTQQPSLTFRVSRQNGVRWEWRVAELQIAGGALRARLLQE